MCQIEVYNDQSSIILFKGEIREVVKFFLEQEDINSDYIAVNIVDNDRISVLHNTFFGDDSATDCISLPIDSPESDGCICLGEIFVSAEMAFNYSIENNTSAKRELFLYIIHSLLHLIGYEDSTEKSRNIMFAKQDHLLNLLEEKLNEKSYMLL